MKFAERSRAGGGQPGSVTRRQPKQLTYLASIDACSRCLLRRQGSAGRAHQPLERVRVR
jgi:hypothetical protein